MKFVMYSGGQTDSNQVLSEWALALSPRGKHSRVTYVPYTYEDCEYFYKKFCKRFSKLGVSKFCLFPLDEPSNAALRKKALNSDIIYLAGGNTFYFLKHLRQSGFMEDLRKFSKRGGVLAGLSAGSILMTPNIGLAAYPKYDADDNEVRLKDLRALHLVDFEFYPHYEADTRHERSLKKYSLSRKHPVFACKDGTGLVVTESTFHTIGHVEVFHRGHQFSL